jgi:hypothetical protein
MASTHRLFFVSQAHNVIIKTLGWTIRYFMVLRNNYLGSFTHFSTLFEYLDKRSRGLPIGDPIMLKYRKENVRLLDCISASYQMS